MSRNTHADRLTILRRRAFFVGSALAAMGCPRDPSPQPGVQPTVGVEPASSAELATSGVTTHGTSEPGEKMPPLDVPSDVNATAKANFESLAQEIPAIHKELDAANAALDGICSIGDRDCDPRWQEVAKHFGQLDVYLDNLAPRCPGTSADAKRFEERLAQHKAFIAKRKSAIEARIAALVADGAAKQKWQDHLAGAVVPRPCLDYSCSDW
jgi:hypothetical protein